MISNANMWVNDFPTVSLFQGTSAVRDEGIQDGVEILLINGIEFSFRSNFLEKGRVASSQVG